MRSIGWISPARWGIPVRSAAVSATVVLVAFIVTSAGLITVLNTTLLASIDAAVTDRITNLISALHDDSPADLDASLLAIDQRIATVQVINEAGEVVRRSAGAPTTAVIPVTDVGSDRRHVVVGDGTDDGFRISGQHILTPQGGYTILVAGSSESAESTLKTVALLLGAAAPIIIAAAAAATYRLVKRSLRSVEAIRVRVSDISTTDLSERVPVPEHRDEISELAHTMNAMLARIEAGHTAQRQFVGDASHELRSPLAAIISALEVGQAHPELLNTELTAGTLIPEAYRMQALVEDLLLLARADERALLPRVEDIDLDDLAEREATRLRRASTHTVYTDLQPARVTGDPGTLTRVLRNLLDNANRHAHSQIDISVHHRDSCIEMTVSDDGPGIPPAKRTAVFDRFVRLDSSRSRGGGGTGLGLSIVAEIVAAHGGHVSISERPGGGTAVRVSLPSRQ